MKYLSGQPFSAPVSNGKITQAEWDKRVGRVENAALDRSGKATAASVYRRLEREFNADLAKPVTRKK